MFGFAKKRQDALRSAIDETQTLLDQNPSPSLPALESFAHDLRLAYDAVLENDRESTYSDPTTSVLVERAAALLEELDKRVKQRSRELRFTSDAQESAELVSRLRLRRCRECDGAVFFVHEHSRVQTQSGEVRTAVIVCAQCGEVRFKTRDAKVLAALADQREFRRVTLPGGDGPFRG